MGGECAEMRILLVEKTTRPVPTLVLLNLDPPPSSSAFLEFWGRIVYAKTYASEMISMIFTTQGYPLSYDKAVRRIHKYYPLSFRKVFKLREPPKAFITTQQP